MASTPCAQVWKAAPEEEMLPAKLPVLNVTVFSAGQKKNPGSFSLKLTQLRDYDTCSVTSPLGYQQR